MELGATNVMVRLYSVFVAFEEKRDTGGFTLRRRENKKEMEKKQNYGKG